MCSSVYCIHEKAHPLLVSLDLKIVHAVNVSDIAVGEQGELGSTV